MGTNRHFLRNILLGVICSLSLASCHTLPPKDVDEVTTTRIYENELRQLATEPIEMTTEVVAADEVVVTAAEDQFSGNEEEHEPRLGMQIQTTSAPESPVVVVTSLIDQLVGNDEENELFREKRDAVMINDEVVTEQTNVVPEEIVEEDVSTADDFPGFRRPTTPDPNVENENNGTGFKLSGNIYELNEELRATLLKEGVNFTGDYVRGRASCKCGVPSDKIVGGVAASIRQYPWTVGLTRGGRPYCGGSLINNYFIATASHCVDGQQANRIQVVIGEQDYTSAHDGANPKRYNVAQIIMHEHYNGKTIDNDIALLRLSAPVSLGGTNIPVCLPATNQNDFTGEIATVAGWGATSQGGSTSGHLRKVEVPIISNSECNGGKSRYSGKITQNMLCAGYLETGGKDSCQGDSGGPLIIENGGRRTLVGIVSWGYGCAQAYAPGVYTRVGRYPDWILSKTRGADWCQG